MSRFSCSDLRLDCQLRMKIACSVWSSLIYFWISRKEALDIHMADGCLCEAQPGSSGCEWWLSLVAWKKVALFYLTQNLVIGNIDLPNDLF